MQRIQPTSLWGGIIIVVDSLLLDITVSCVFELPCVALISSAYPCLLEEMALSWHASLICEEEKTQSRVQTAE